MNTDWSQIRARYPALRNYTYFNSATFGLLSTNTTQAVNAHFAHRDDLACNDFLEWFDDIDGTRAKAAQLIHATAEDIAFSVNAATPLSLLLGGTHWSAGDRIVTLTNEFPNQLYYAALLKEKGVEFIEVEWPEFYDAITPNTRAVLLSQVSYTTGFRPPLEQIGAFLKERGILFYVDATQALGALTLNVKHVQPSMLAVHGYKWLLCPNGAAFFYVSPELRKTLEPNIIGWRSHEDWRNVNRLHHGAPVFRDSAEKYEGGMPAFPCLYAMDAALTEFLEIGAEKIERRVLALTSALHERLQELGHVTVLHRHSPITAAHFPATDPALLVHRLKEKRILASARHGCLRLSMHFYNDESDIDRLIAALR
ncbi:MAG: aminotransferase class V-fold PLP-dependent enzyme [Acidobacteria bacterium]|nr:aminotransferase class V-fold PLP-dependent enzyme [Acidobacteriota bacterium]